MIAYITCVELDLTSLAPMCFRGKIPWRLPDSFWSSWIFLYNHSPTCRTNHQCNTSYRNKQKLTNFEVWDWVAGTHARISKYIYEGILWFLPHTPEVFISIYSQYHLLLLYRFDMNWLQYNLTEPGKVVQHSHNATSWQFSLI